MSSETQSQTRKRKDKKRKTEYESDSHDVSKEDSPSKDDHESSDDHHDSHHGPPGGVLSTIVFICLLGGLVVLTSLIYLELKGSKELGPSISESRYASILGDFVDEHPPDDHDHDDHGEADDGHHGGGEHGEGGGEHGHSEHDGEGHGGDHGEEEEELGFFQSFTAFDSPESHDDEETVSVAPRSESTEQEDTLQIQETPSEYDDELPREFSDHSQTEEEILRESLLENDTPNLAQPEEQAEQIEDQPAAQVDEHVERADEQVEQIDEQIEQIDEQVEQIDEQVEQVDEQFEQIDEHAEEVEQVAGQIDEQVEQVAEHSEQSEEFAETADQIEEQLEQTNEESVDQAEHVDEQTEDNAGSPAESEIAEDFVPEDELADAEIRYVEEILDIPNEVQAGAIENEEEIQITPVADVVNEGDSDVETDSSHQENFEGSESQADWAAYEQADITNQYDYEIYKELDSAEKEMEKSAENSKILFEELLKRYPESPRATFGKAKALDVLSELQKSNFLLEESIYTYRDVLDLPNVPDKLFRLAGSRCADRMRFRGFIAKSSRIYQRLIQKFPDDASFRNQLAVSYLLLGDNSAGRIVLQEVLRKFPDDGFAKVHYGFLLKTDDQNYEEAVKYLREGIATGEEGTVDGRFYFQLGDALMRGGFPDQAMAVYEEGVKKKLFLSVYQRSLYNVDSLTGRPWWTPEQTTYQLDLEKIRDQWQTIRDEGLALLDDKQEGFLPESEGLKETGVWKQFELFARGKILPENCRKAPKTCQLINSIPEAANCKRGQVKFSIMHPGTHIWAHTGPTNCRLRAHLGLVVPEGVRIRVANETRSWKEGVFIIFDDSFEHEVWHEGNSFRLVLIVDFWHPELTENERRTLTTI